MKRLPMLLLGILLLPTVAAQDIGELLRPIDEVLGDNVPPAIGTLYETMGQNITREDVRLHLDMDFTKGDVGLFGLLLGSGTAEVEAHVRLRVDMRVISSDRIRAAAEGENAYNVSAENATFLSGVYLPAEVFRASLSAELIARFQAEQEKALRDYLAAAMPELELLGLDVAWENTEPQRTIDDSSLTEPPITLFIDASVRYLRTESVPSLLQMYFDRDPEAAEGRKAYIERLKRENGDPPHARDFFAAAAYTQLLNLSMQPGWLLDVSMRVPRGYSFEYANDEVDVHSERHISFQVDALEQEREDEAVLLVSLTHRRAVAVALFGLLLAAGVVIGAPLKFLYGRRRILTLDARLAEAGQG